MAIREAVNRAARRVGGVIDKALYTGHKFVSQLEPGHLRAVCLHGPTDLIQHSKKALARYEQTRRAITGDHR